MSNMLCKKCRKNASLMCHRCLDPYCSIDCQTLDWHEHKAICIKMPPLIPVADIFRKAVTNGASQQELQKPTQIQNTQCESVDLLQIEDPTLQDNHEAWKNHFPIVNESNLEVLILTIIELKPPLAWVSEEKYSEEYFKFLMSMADAIKMERINWEQIKDGTLVAIELEGHYHRGEVLSIWHHAKKAKIRLIDIGRDKYVTSDKIYKAAERMFTTPGFAFKVRIKGDASLWKVDNVVRLRLLDQKFADGVRFAEILPPRKSTGMEIIPTTAMEKDSSNPKSGPEPSEIYTLKDLKVTPLSTGPNVHLAVLDSSNIHDGFITATDLSNEEQVRKLEINLKLIEAYGQSTSRGDKYIPRINEICLAVFEDDGAWYRAICIGECENGRVEVKFIDYGNKSKVCAEKILPIPQHLMFPSNANTCFIQGMSKRQREEFVLKVAKTPHFHCKVTQWGDDDSAYTISLNEMQLNQM